MCLSLKKRYSIDPIQKCCTAWTVKFVLKRKLTTTKFKTNLTLLAVHIFYSINSFQSTKWLLAISYWYRWSFYYFQLGWNPAFEEPKLQSLHQTRRRYLKNYFIMQKSSAFPKGIPIENFARILYEYGGSLIFQI